MRANGVDNVLVLEARDRVGGRTLTKIKDDKCWVDLGGSYVGPTQNSVLKLIEELKLETYLVDDIEDGVYLRAGPGNRVDRRVQWNPQNDPPFGNLLNWLDYVHMVRLIDSLGEQIPSDEPWSAPRARELDSITWRQFVDQNAWTERVRTLLSEFFISIDVCCEADEASALWQLWYVKQCGGYGRSISTTNGGQERKVKGGTQQLSEGLRQQVGPERVLFNKPVYRIDQRSGNQVEVRTVDGSAYTAEHLICAVSPHLWLKFHHEPALPAGKSLLAQRSPMGTVAKVILYYEREFWKQHNLSGFFIFDSRDRSAHPVILTLNDTKPDGSHPAIIGFVAARGCFEMRDKPELEVAEIVARSYAQATQLDEFLNFSHCERFDWTEEQYSGGCYTTCYPPNALTKYGPHLREPFGRIHYAGTETAIKWSGYMDGALSAGKRAARQVLRERGKPMSEADVWQEEPDSRLVPPKPFVYPDSYRWAPSIGTLVAVGQVTCFAVALLAGIRHLGSAAHQPLNFLSVARGWCAGSRV